MDFPSYLNLNGNTLLRGAGDWYVYERDHLAALREAITKISHLGA